MENKHTPSGSKIEKPLIIHLENELINYNIQDISERLNIKIEFSSFPESSHLIINTKNDLLSLTFSDNGLHTFTLKNSLNNILEIIKSVHKKINSSAKTETSTISYKDNKLDKIFDAKIKKYHDWVMKKGDLLTLCLFSNTIQQIPKSLVSLNKFSNYLSSHILVHPKGHSSAKVYNYNKNTDMTGQTIGVNEFNSLFKIIKKSKNKSFNSTQINGEFIDLVGSFLAKEIELSKYNVIIIISRNDFLAPNKDEISYFNSFSNLLPLFITHLLESELESKRILSSSEILNNIPIPIRIINKTGKELLSNNEFTNREKINLEKSINLTNELKLEIYDIVDDENSTSDIFHFQRLSLLGELLNTLRHELSNPLFGLKLATDLVDADEFPEEDQETLSEINKSIERCQLIIENFSNLYQAKSSNQIISLKKLIDECLTLTKSITKGLNKYIEYIHIEEDNELKLSINPTWFVQILFNLIINSAQSLKSIEEERRDLFFKILVDKIEDKISISVIDNGPGLKNIDDQDIFKPFKTTKKSGTGLGLSISKSLAKKMNGDLYFSGKDKENGASFTLELPTK